MKQSVDFIPKRIHIYDYSDDIKEVMQIDCIGFGRSGGRKGRKSSEVNPEDREKNLKKIKKKCRRLALANDLSIHLVLTYKENMQDVDKADNHFKKFIFELRQIYPKLKYMATRELQKRGAIHYHVLLNQRISNKKAQNLWNNGYISIMQHRNKLQGIMYVLKYIMKEVGENVMVTKNGHTKKAYLSSQGLKNELDKCTLKYVITLPEHYIFMQDKINMMMTNLTEGWDKEFEIQIDDERTIKGRSILKYKKEKGVN